jgi:NADH-quinone oxidoreductase subunit G
VLHNAASRVGALDIGFVPGAGGLSAPAQAKAGALDLLFLVGADEIAVEPGGFVVYIGSHGDRGAHRADVILPGAAYTEKSGTYVNTEGRVQMTDRAAFPPGDAREDWAIFRALSATLDKTLPFDSLSQLRGQLYASVPHLAKIDEIETADGASLASLPAGALGQAVFVSPIADFYLTNPIARASKVMAECSALAKGAALKQAAE